MKKGNSRGIAVSGISSALIILSLYGGVIIVNNKLFFIALAVAIAGIPYASSGIKIGLLAYAASSILAVVVLPNKIYAIMFIILGIYPLVKLISEHKKFVIEFAYKLIWFNFTMIALYFVFNNFIYLDDIFNNNIGKALLLIAVNVLFIIYDFVFSKFIMFIFDRVLRKN